MQSRERISRSALSLILCLLVLNGCQDSMGPDSYQPQRPPNNNEFAMDMALVAADAVLEDIDAWGSEFDFSIGLGFESATSVNDEKSSKNGWKIDEQ